MDIDNPSYFTVPGASEPSCATRNKIKKADSLGSSSDASFASRKNSKTAALRTFLRSVSSASADTSEELLIMGEPRLSDIDPELAATHPSFRRGKILRNELVYCALLTSEEEANELSSDEVFLDKDTCRYYNISAKNRQRRHSIGTFPGRDRSSRGSSATSSIKSLKEDFLQGAPLASDFDVVDGAAHEAGVKHSSFPRRRCRKCAKGSAVKLITMDDILIVSLKNSQPASLWADYFASYFQQISKQANRKPFRIRRLAAEDFFENPSENKSVVEKCIGVKLQLVVVCPEFLNCILDNSNNVDFGKLFLPDRTLALLLGVTDADISDIHAKVLPTYFKWERLSVGQDQDENFTKEFLGHAMAILSRVWKQQSSVVHQEKSGFSVSPKKIRQDQNTLFILFMQPLQKEDVIKVSIEKNNELYELKSLKRKNPYTIKISVPENFTEVTAIINILVEKNGDIIGSRPIKCESRLRELEQILRSANNPVEFLCQTLGFSPADKEHLDNWLVHGFQKNIPPNFNLLSNHSSPFHGGHHVQRHSYEEFPTLLHFAAKFGFDKLAMQLLDCPGADIAYDVKNVYDMTPAEIAEANDHAELASALKGYMNMNEFTKIYSTLKEMSSSSKGIDESGYLTPRNLADLYKVCPAPRPVTLKLPSRPVSPCMDAKILTPTSSPIDINHLGYTPMHVPSKTEDHTPLTLLEEKMPQVVIDAPLNHNKTKKHHGSQNMDPKPEPFPSFYEDKVQIELLEIINDFKNNVHSISQVEKLVEEWKNRNDVQKSCKEKQEQLNQMRLKYEKIQQEMKLASKKPSPFERVKKLFSRHHKPKEEHHEISRPTGLSSTTTLNLPLHQRPISSLSTSSSGSSGRMSTISGCSLGDSGTHSDNEERKNMMSHSSEDDFRNELNKAILELHYTPVPMPKPVKMNYTLHKSKFSTIEESPSTKVDPMNNQYYIRFPPSGLPVPELIVENSEIPSSPTNEYMNIPSCNNNNVKSQDCISEPHEYMNLRAPNSIK